MDSRAIARKIDIAFQRETIFAGALRGKDEDTLRSLGLPLPYVVDDLYGWAVPENLRNYAPTSILRPRPETPRAHRRARPPLLVVRDGVAGFFFTRFTTVRSFERINDDITAVGYVRVGGVLERLVRHRRASDRAATRRSLRDAINARSARALSLRGGQGP